MKKVIKNTIIVICVLIFSLIILSGCQNKKETDINMETNNNIIEINNNNLDGLKEYTNKRYENYIEYNGNTGVKFAYPSTWVSVGVEGKIEFINPDDTLMRVNFGSADFPTGMTFEQFMKASEEGIKQVMELKSEVQEERINLNGKEAYKLDYSATQNDDKTIHTIQVAFVDDGSIYILTVFSNEESFENNREELEKILTTFRK